MLMQSFLSTDMVWMKAGIKHWIASLVPTHLSHEQSSPFNYVEDVCRLLYHGHVTFIEG